MTNLNKEVPPGSEDFIPTQQPKRKRRSNTNESDSSSVKLSKTFPRVLADISNIAHNMPSEAISTSPNPNNDNGIDENAQGKRLKSNSFKSMSQSSNQTTPSNIVRGSNNVSTTRTRKRSATIENLGISSKKQCAKTGVLADVTNICPTASTLPFQLGTPSTSGSCISKIVSKGKGKAVAGGVKFNSKTITKSCKKILEPQFDGCVDDNSSSEVDEEQAYQCDYEEESELYQEQVYDCSSEESDESDCETINCDPMLSTDADHKSPNVLSTTKTNTRSSCTRMTKATSSRKQHGYIDDGDPIYKCEHCGAIMWYGERINNKKNTRKPKFALCCGQGQVQLPLLKDSPTTLKQLLYGDDEKSRYFRENIRQLNMVFSFTSLGGKCDRSVPKGCGPIKMFVFQGENYHLMGSLKPPEGDPAKFGQLYIVDTENEIINRASIIGKYKTSAETSKKERIREQVIEILLKMLNEVNPYVHQFRSAKDRFNTNPEETFHMRIISSRAKDGRTYDTPTASEVAALIPGDFNLDMDKRDIVLQEKQTGWLKTLF